jgi:GNAT superfamily N-acetyltransferase
MEIKRMYTSPSVRGKGIAGLILTELEKWAAELSYSECILETGKRQPAAIALYSNRGYQKIDNYGPYKNDENSVCFEKHLSKK